MVSWSKEEIVHLLTRVQKTIETIERRNQTIQSVHDYLLNENGMEKLDAACMLIQTIGENIKTINEKTEGKLFVQYPEIPWKAYNNVLPVPNLYIPGSHHFYIFAPCKGKHSYYHCLLTVLMI